MKVIVMQTRDGKAAVLDEQGIFHTIEDQNYIVGQRLEMTELELRAAGKGKPAGNVKSGGSRFTGVPRAAAAVLACVLVGGGVTAYAAPVSTVTISQDYTVEYKLNIFDRVVRAEAYAPEGEELTEDLRQELIQKAKGRNIADALDLTLEAMEKLEPEGEGREIQLNVIGIGGKAQLSEELAEKVDDWNESHAQNMDMQNTDIPEEEGNNVPKKDEKGAEEGKNGIGGSGVDTENVLDQSDENHRDGKPKDEEKTSPDSDIGNIGGESGVKPSGENGTESGNQPPDAGSQPQDRQGSQPQDRQENQPQDRQENQPQDRQENQPQDRQESQPPDDAGNQLQDGQGNPSPNDAGGRLQDGPGNQPANDAGNQLQNEQGSQSPDDAGNQLQDGAGSQPPNEAGSQMQEVGGNQAVQSRPKDGGGLGGAQIKSDIGRDAWK